MDPWLDIDLGGIANFTSLRNRNPNAKFIYSVGGYNAGSAVFSKIAANPTARAIFANYALDLTLRHNFDGFDLDWEYPNQRDTVHGYADRENFVLLCQQLFNVLQPAGKTFGIAVAATASSARTSYDVPKIHPYIDFILVMTYDFHGSWNSFTGHHSAMYRGPYDTTPELQELNVEASINWWISAGVPRSKIIVGMPTYGKTFTLSYPNQNGINAPSSGPGNAGIYTPFEPGFLMYSEICQKINSGWTRVWEATQKVPYAFSGNQWVGYDDVESIAYKLNYVVRENLGGAMWWSIESDDFRNFCGHGSFPLIRLAQNSMRP